MSITHKEAAASIWSAAEAVTGDRERATRLLLRALLHGMYEQEAIRPAIQALYDGDLNASRTSWINEEHCHELENAAAELVSIADRLSDEWTSLAFGWLEEMEGAA